jgi:allantoinase
VHAEDADEIARAAPALSGGGFSSYLASRPASAEVAAIRRVIAGSRSTGTMVHVVHLSAAEALPDIEAAKKDGVRLTVETCPHYLAITAEEIPDGATQFKCTPPIREQNNREVLWSALSRGAIDCVVSDHAPCTVEGKYLDTGDFDRAGPGIASLQLSLSIVWTEASTRGHSLTDVSRWMASNTAAFAGVDRKGAIAEGRDADLVWFAPEGTFTVDAENLLHRNPITAYQGRALRGVVRRTWLRGRAVDVDDGPHGALLRRDIG